MAKGKKTGGRDFTPGHKLGGRPKSNGDLKAIKKSLLDEVHKVAEVLTMPLNEAYAALQNQENSLLHYIMGQAIKNNNDRVILAFLDRTIGKPKESKEEENKDTRITLNYNLDKEPGEYRHVKEISNRDNEEES